jgi:PQQ-dependent dehydrogenase (methanol/ethanol family)
MNLNRILKAVVAASLVIALPTMAFANDDLLRLQEEPANFVMSNANYAGWNYSPLDQINVDNVQNLQVAWTFQTGVLDSHEAQPLVIDDTMYLVTPKPNYVYALDLSPGNEGVIKWEFRPDMPELETAIARACCGAQTRGLAYAEGRLFYNTLDGQVFSLDAESGEVLWRAENTNLAIAETMSTHPLIVGSNVIVGVMGGEYGVRGHVTAYDLHTGSLRWRYYSMGPNNEVGIGPRFDPFYPDDQIDNPALDSWEGDSWRRGGGTVWGWFTFDPDNNLFYYATGNCGPWNPDYRRPWGEIDLDDQGGIQSYRSNYCASILARDATTGELIWAYNLTPQDHWDLDEPNTNILIDLEVDGEMRHTLVRPARNGFFYVFDRLTGEILNDPWTFVPVDFATGVDLETGRLLIDINYAMWTDLEDRQRYIPDATDVDVRWCPGIAARNWHNDAYSPRTGLVYVPAQHRCQAQIVIELEYTPGANYTARQSAGPNTSPEGWMGKTLAIDPVANEVVWEITYENSHNMTPLFATGGDLLFRGDLSLGRVEAIDARTGEILWHFRTGSNFQNSPITYMGPDGRQYMAIIASQRAGQDNAIGPDAAPDDEARYRRGGTTMYVFALPEAMAGN